MKKKDERGEGDPVVPRPMETKPAKFSTTQPSIGVVQRCSGCHEVVSVEIRRVDARPLLGLVERLLRAYKKHDTMRFLSPTKHTHLDVFSLLDVRASEQGVVGELEKFGCGELFPHVNEGSEPFVWDVDVMEAVHAVWLVVTSPKCEEWLKSGMADLKIRIDRLDAALGLLRAAVECDVGDVIGSQVQSPPDVPPPQVEAIPAQYVTLSQMAAIVTRSKRTLEKDLRAGRLPLPDIRGKGGRPHEWNWATARPILQHLHGRILPVRFPTSQFLDQRANRS